MKLSDTRDLTKIKINSFRFSLVAIISIFIFELLGGLYSNSLAILTDAFHALLDAFITLMLLIAAKLSSKPRDIDHTYGHGKIESIGGMLGGIILFGVAIVFIHESYVRLQEPHSLVNPSLFAFLTLIFVLFVDFIRIAILNRSFKLTQSTTIKSDLYHAVSDVCSTLIALIGLWAVTINFHYGDPLAAIALGGFLIFFSSKLIYSCIRDLTDAISPDLVKTVSMLTSSTPGIIDCKDVRMRKVGQEIYIDIIVEISADNTFREAHNIATHVEHHVACSIRNKYGISSSSVTVHFEPYYSSNSLISLVRDLVLEIDEVKGVHNILAARIKNTDDLIVSLHVQIASDYKLEEANIISKKIENAIKKQNDNVRHVISHIEPVFVNVDELKPVEDDEIEEFIRTTVINNNSVSDIKKILIFKTNGNHLKIDIWCVFTNRIDTIEEVHKQVSRIEDVILSKYPKSILTIHSEPVK